MSDDRRPVKVHRVTLLVVDHDNIGEAELRVVIENQRYPNRCIAPSVLQVETREVEWSDEHPLNLRVSVGRDQRLDVLDALFEDKP